MSILTKEMRNEFISGLRVKYAKDLPSKFIANRNDIMFAAANLYASGTPFWTRGRQAHWTSTHIHNIETMLTNFVDEINNYFIRFPSPSNQSIFDNFHKQLCNIFLSDCRSAGFHHTYGNAQKMTNILFKYLACFADASTYEDWFTYCHMALDRFTYNGYRLPFYRDVVYPLIHGNSIKKLTTWSNLSPKEYTDVTSDIVSYINFHPKTYNYYLDICKKHLGILGTVSLIPASSDYELHPFEAEFFLWIIAKECNKKTVNMSMIQGIKKLL